MLYGGRENHIHTTHIPFAELKRNNETQSINSEPDKNFLPGEIIGERAGGVESSAPIDPDAAPLPLGAGAGVGEDGFDISSVEWPIFLFSFILIASPFNILPEPIKVRG